MNVALFLSMLLFVQLAGVFEYWDMTQVSLANFICAVICGFTLTLLPFKHQTQR